MAGKTLRPLQLLVLGMAGLINDEQQHVVEYLQMENKILKEIIGKKSILLNDNQRRRFGMGPACEKTLEYCVKLRQKYLGP